MKKIFITGGAGYVGTRLVPFLLKDGYQVTVYDTFYFGNFLPSDPNLKAITGDIRDKKKIYESIPLGADLIHLACISNDASFALNPELSKTVNFDAFVDLVASAKKRGVKKFIYASTSSVYGVSEKTNVTEDHPLKPITHYNDYKGRCEPILLQALTQDFQGVVFRPATVCGFSPRMRLDLSVNILTAHAITRKKMTVFGGSQKRPNLHILDYISAVQLFLKTDQANGEIYNIGNENLTLSEIALLVRRTLGEINESFKQIDIETTQSDDIRSYHIDSSKIKSQLGFVPQFKIEDAVIEIYEAFKRGHINSNIEENQYHNVKTLLADKVL
jgi:nucleoside-diphosphate-sugar epimerase